MKKLRWATDCSGFWDLDVSTPVTLQATARPLPSPLLPLGLSRGVQLARPKQLHFMHNFMSMPFVPSYSPSDHGFSLHRALSLPLGHNWCFFPLSLSLSLYPLSFSFSFSFFSIIIYLLASTTSHTVAHSHDLTTFLLIFSSHSRLTVSYMIIDFEFHSSAGLPPCLDNSICKSFCPPSTTCHPINSQCLLGSNKRGLVSLTHLFMLLASAPSILSPLIVLYFSVLKRMMIPGALATC